MSTDPITCWTWTFICHLSSPTTPFTHYITWVKRSCIKLESLWVHKNSPVTLSGQPRAPRRSEPSSAQTRPSSTDQKTPNCSQRPDLSPTPLHFHFSRHLAAGKRAFWINMVSLLLSPKISSRKTMYNVGTVSSNQATKPTEQRTQLKFHHVEETSFCGLARKESTT